MQARKLKKKHLRLYKKYWFSAVRLQTKYLSSDPITLKSTFAAPPAQPWQESSRVISLSISFSRSGGGGGGNVYVVRRGRRGGGD